MSRAFEELVGFIASRPSAYNWIAFRASGEAQFRVSQLLNAERETGLSEEDTSELDEYLRLEHVVRIAKAHARLMLQRATG